MSISNELNPINLAISAIRTGNLNLLRVLIDWQVQLKHYFPSLYDQIKEMVYEEQTIIIQNTIKIEQLQEIDNFIGGFVQSLDRLNNNLNSIVDQNKQTFYLSNFVDITHKEKRLYIIKRKINTACESSRIDRIIDIEQVYVYKKKLENDINEFRQNLEKIRKVKETNENYLDKKFNLFRLKMDNMAKKLSANILTQDKESKFSLKDIIKKLKTASLLVNTVHPDTGESLLILAIRAQQTKIVEFLLFLNADEKEILEHSAKKLFKEAIYHHQIPIIHRLIFKYGYSLSKLHLSYRYERNNTLLHYALSQKDYKLAWYLIQQGAHFFAQNEYELTPWQIAIDSKMLLGNKMDEYNDFMLNAICWAFQNHLFKLTPLRYSILEWLEKLSNKNLYTQEIQQKSNWVERFKQLILEERLKDVQEKKRVLTELISLLASTAHYPDDIVLVSQLNEMHKASENMFNHGQIKSFKPFSQPL